MKDYLLQENLRLLPAPNYLAPFDSEHLVQSIELVTPSGKVEAQVSADEDGAIQVTLNGQSFLVPANSLNLIAKGGKHPEIIVDGIAYPAIWNPVLNSLTLLPPSQAAVAA